MQVEWSSIVVKGSHDIEYGEVARLYTLTNWLFLEVKPSLYVVFVFEIDFSLLNNQQVAPASLYVVFVFEIDFSLLNNQQVAPASLLLCVQLKTKLKCCFTSFNCKFQWL